MNHPLQTKHLFFHSLAALSAFAGLANSAHAADQSSSPAPSSLQKPAWLSDLSLDFREGYDDNVFMSGVASKNLPPLFTVPPGSVAALPNQSSRVTTVSPKVGVNFAPLLGSQSAFETLSLAYAPDFVIYHDQSSENYDAHRFLTAIKGHVGSFSFTADNTLTYIDGNNFGPTFPGGVNFYSGWATIAQGLRVEQIQDVAKVALRYDQDKFFLRPAASLLYYDMRSELLNLPALGGFPNGYQNYPDRYDVNGGMDFGYKIIPGLALTLGYRYGHQYQQQMSFSPYSSPNDYQRVLLGAEGKLWQCLSFSLQGGPDFRSYAPNTAMHITPVSDHHPIKYYGDVAITIDATPRDAISFKYKAWQWLSMCGRIPVLDSRYDLTYHRVLCHGLTLDLGAHAWDLDYTSGNISLSRRNDIMYSASAGFTWAATAHFSVNAAYTANLGRNLQNMPDPQNREFDQNLASLGIQYKF